MLRVVIADDERIIRRTIRLIGNWEENNMEIVGEAQNGLEAVELIKTKTPDVILLDMKMPGCSGDQVLKFIDVYKRQMVYSGEYRSDDV